MDAHGRDRWLLQMAAAPTAPPRWSSRQTLLMWSPLVFTVAVLLASLCALAQRPLAAPAPTRLHLTAPSSTARPPTGQTRAPQGPKDLWLQKAVVGTAATVAALTGPSGPAMADYYQGTQPPPPPVLSCVALPDTRGSLRGPVAQTLPRRTSEGQAQGKLRL